MTNKTPSGAEKHHESTEPESSKTAKCFQVLLSSFFFRRASSTLRELLTVVYARSSSILYGAVHNPIALHNVEVLQGARMASHLLKNYGFHFGTPFSSFIRRMRTSGLPSNDPKLLTQDR